jgi:hypothetical protein
MKIALHDNGLGLRGTTVALYDYAYYLKYLYNYECVILYNIAHSSNNHEVVNKFLKEFEVYSYSSINELDDIIDKKKIEKLFLIKGGKKDGVISKNCANLINAIAICSENDIHGEVFAMGSKWLSKITGYKIPYVPYMINLPTHEKDMRTELNIPKDAMVFGRNGGYDTFDIQFVKKTIIETIDKRNDIYFIFQNTEKFIKHDRAIFLDGSSDMNKKVEFINTCDMMLHARQVGESFGLSCGEFSTRNKPVITYYDSPEKNHIDILGDNGFFYKTEDDIKNLLLNISKDDLKDKNWNCYTEYTPQNVMEKFKKIYLK